MKLLEKTRARLEELYTAGVGLEEMLRIKRTILRELRDQYAQLKRAWGGYAAFDRWFDRPLNNAHLASINTYHAFEPAFRRILQQADGDMANFHTACRAIAAMPAARREAAMNSLLDASGPR